MKPDFYSAIQKAVHQKYNPNDIPEYRRIEHAQVEALISFELSLMHEKGVYFTDIHSMHIGETARLDADTFVVLLHEAVHAAIGDLSIGYYIGDLFQLDKNLSLLTSRRMIDVLKTFLPRIGVTPNESNMLRYPSEHALELDVVLCKNSDYTSAAKLYLKVHRIYKYMHDNHSLMSEGVATFISLNYDGWAEMLDNKQVKVENMRELLLDIRRVQTEKKNEFLATIKTQASQKHLAGYYYAEKIVQRFGWDGLMISAVAATDIPYYNIDLIGCPEDELDSLLERYYNCDRKWVTFSNLTIEEFLTVNNSDDPIRRFSLLLSGVSEFPKRQHEFRQIADYTLRYTQFHPLMLELQKDLYQTAPESLIDEIKSLRTNNDHEYPIDEINSIARFRTILWDTFVEGMRYIETGVASGKEKVAFKSVKYLDYASDKLHIGTHLITVKYVLECLQQNRGNVKLDEILRSDRNLTSSDVNYICFLADKLRGHKDVQLSRMPSLLEFLYGD